MGFGAVNRIPATLLLMVASTTVLFSQDAVEVEHFAGNPGGPGRRDGIGTEARFVAPRSVWGTDTHMFVADDPGLLRRIDRSTGAVGLFAGGGTGDSPDGFGPDARFGSINDLWGNETDLYVADATEGIRRISLTTGEVITLVRSAGSPTLTDDAPPSVDGLLENATVWVPIALWGTDSELFVLERGSMGFLGPARFWTRLPVLRRIDLGKGTISRINLDFADAHRPPWDLAGTDEELILLLSGSAEQLALMDLETGDFRFVDLPRSIVRAFPGIAPLASFTSIWIALDETAYLTSSSNAVFTADLATGEVERVAGRPGYIGWTDGSFDDALFRDPLDLWGDTGGTLYIADRGNYSVRTVDPASRTVRTLAGAGIRNPMMDRSPVLGVDWSDGRYLYYTRGGYRRFDGRTGDPDARVWRLPIEGGPPELFAGDGTVGTRDGPAESAQFQGPSEVWGNDTDLYVADDDGKTIRRISRATGAVSTLVGAPGLAGHMDGPPGVARFEGPDQIWGNSTHLYVTDGDTVRSIEIATGTVTTLAGSPTVWGFQDGGGLDARFVSPMGLWGDAAYLYIADTFNGTIRRMSLASNEVETIGGQARLIDIVDGQGTAARFRSPADVWGDGTYLYVTDESTLRRVRLSDFEVKTIAGMPGVSGSTDGVGSEARFGTLGKLWGVGDTLFVSDSGRVRTIDLATFEVRTLLEASDTTALDGTGAGALFSRPSAILGDSTHLWVVDSDALRQIDRSTRTVRTVAGLTDQPGDRPVGLCSDGAFLYVADERSDLIRRVDPDGWAVDTFAGTARVEGHADGYRPVATFDSPAGLWCDSTTILVADRGNEAIRRIDLASGEVSTLFEVGDDVHQVWSDGSHVFFTTDNTLNRLEPTTGELSVLVSDVRFPRLGNMWGIDGDLYVPAGHAILRVDLDTGDFDTIAGHLEVWGSENGSGAAARFFNPTGIWGDGQSFYVVDSDNFAIRRMSIASPRLRFDLPTSGATSFSTVSEAPEVEVSHARVRSDGSSPADAVALFRSTKAGVVVSEAAVPAMSPFLDGRVRAENGMGVRTGVALLNPNDAEVSIRIYFSDKDGRNFGQRTLTLAPDRQISAFLDEEPYSRGSPPNPFGGFGDPRTFTFNASLPVAAIGLRGRVNERGDFLTTTLPVADLSRTETGPAAIPYFAEGGGWSTSVLLLNTGDTTQSGTLRFYDPEGIETATETYAIAARSSVLIERKSEDSAISTGSIRIEPDAATTRPAATSIFAFDQNGVRVTETGVPLPAPGNRFRILAERGSDLRSGFAFSNMEAAALTLAYEVDDRLGRPTRISGTLEVPGNGVRTLFLDELSGAELLTREFLGFLKVSAPGERSLAMVGLRTRTNARGDFLVSTIMPPDPTPSQGTRYLPFLAVGGGYTTEFILASPDGESRAGELDFFRQSGEPLTLRTESQ